MRRLLGKQYRDGKYVELLPVMITHACWPAGLWFSRSDEDGFGLTLHANASHERYGRRCREAVGYHHGGPPAADQSRLLGQSCTGRAREAETRLGRYVALLSHWLESKRKGAISSVEMQVLDACTRQQRVGLL